MLLLIGGLARAEVDSRQAETERLVLADAERPRASASPPRKSRAGWRRCRRVGRSGRRGDAAREGPQRGVNSKTSWV
ncbi:MAG: hypothetical protein KC468_03970, partial [Myxococcales bacterium]|nr:hypothetical protein [Myxococcales bacterium]